MRKYGVSVVLGIFALTFMLHVQHCLMYYKQSYNLVQTHLYEDAQPLPPIQFE